MWSISARKCSRRSAMVEPGMTPTPPVITRVGMPSVWESTAWKTLFVLIDSPRGEGWRAGVGRGRSPGSRRGVRPDAGSQPGAGLRPGTGSPGPAGDGG
ncbi:hypothetical protein GCM10010517_21720 [Streptosporangium fragile]|uniref:Uncharacterized protein n=1 Tax=Streptosporangium fragile TaxID=46186 RepID=A0ABN3VW97_9ACTN